MVVVAAKSKGDTKNPSYRGLKKSSVQQQQQRQLNRCVKEPGVVRVREDVLAHPAKEIEGVGGISPGLQRRTKNEERLCPLVSFSAGRGHLLVIAAGLAGTHARARGKRPTYRPPPTIFEHVNIERVSANGRWKKAETPNFFFCFFLLHRHKAVLRTCRFVYWIC